MSKLTVPQLLERVKDDLYEIDPLAVIKVYCHASKFVIGFSIDGEHKGWLDMVHIQFVVKIAGGLKSYIYEVWI